MTTSTKDEEDIVVNKNNINTTHNTNLNCPSFSYDSPTSQEQPASSPNNNNYTSDDDDEEEEKEDSIDNDDVLLGLALERLSDRISKSKSFSTEEEKKTINQKRIVAAIVIIGPIQQTQEHREVDNVVVMNHHQDINSSCIPFIRITLVGDHLIQ